MAVYTIQLAGNHTRPASREACRRAAVVFTDKLHFSRAPPRPMGAVWGAGVLPLLVDVDGEVGVLEGVGFAVEVVEGGAAHGGGRKVFQILGRLDDVNIQ